MNCKVYQKSIKVIGGFSGDKIILRVDKKSLKKFKKDRLTDILLSIGRRLQDL